MGAVAPASAGAEAVRDLAQLRRAERIILVIRWAVMIAWLPIFHAAALPPRPAVDVVLAAVALYTAGSTWAVLRSPAIRATAAATMIGDALGVFAMCMVTGGLSSDIYPYFYLHLLTTAIRFGLTETFAALAQDVVLSLLLFAWAEPGPGAAATTRELGLRLFYLFFVAVTAGLLSHDAKTYSRRALHEGDQRKELLWRLIGIQEDERKRIAGEIHDRMGQRFFHFHYALGEARSALSSRSAEADAKLGGLEQEARVLSDEVRDIMNELRPSVLDDFGFVEALREYVAWVQAHGSLSVTLTIDEAGGDLRPELSVALFRILQEAVLNVRRHAGASRLVVAFATAPSGSAMLTVRDDGRGFDPKATQQGHYGLRTMRERAEACGGRLEVLSRPGNGTELTVTVPTASML